MSRISRSTAFGAPRAQGRAVSPASSGSPGVDVTLRGWKVGLNKVRLTRTLRDGGLPLADASLATGRLLDGEAVRVHVDQFATVEAARDEMRGIGVESVDGTEQVRTHMTSEEVRDDGA